jgi:hypothetical protein
MIPLKFLFPALIIALASLLAGCVMYQRYPLAKSRLAIIDKEPLTFYLLDVAQPRSRVWYISEAEFQEKNIKGFLVKLSAEEARDIAFVANNRDAKASKDEVLLYAKPKFAMTLNDTMTVTIPHDQLEKIEVYEVNHGKSVAVSAFAILVPVVFLGIVSSY